ncbi:MAG: DEAD/DEAH box helicase [Thermosynechococcaceae cyanobacterium MS004]|nr:DEAD/DEAH box helicase [Thermosynechococcaceae cyanobacterium MS004]
MASVFPGSIVTCRSRQWVVLPSDLQDVVRLRPLSGNEDEILGIFDPLELERFSPAQFPKPDAKSLQDHASARLLLDAARLTLRSGAGPFRSLGRLSVRPRPFQLVPLLMALRLETVRLLVADDVGIGKTIEAGLIARELLDRNEIRRIAVLCPPHLCDQWQKELKDKFCIDAVIVRSGTVAKLEREKPIGDSHIFSYFRHVIVSLDYVKSERRRAAFVSYCPDFVIVDEAHTCTVGAGHQVAQQQRYQLLKEISANASRHLVLLTATPHSGLETSFLSLLGLLRPEFEQLNLDQMTTGERVQLAKHFIQRRRADVERWLGDETPFPVREPYECDYELSKPYRALFDQVYQFALGLVQSTTDEMSYGQRRGRYWSALALIRCVMSSPAAAIATLSRQLEKRGEADSEVEVSDEFLGAYVYDSMELETVVDAAPTVVIEQGQQSYIAHERRSIRAFIQAAEEIQGVKDSKLQALEKIVHSLLAEGLNPIIWCRYIATAEYVAVELRRVLEKKNNGMRVIAITGELSDSERDLRLAEFKDYEKRVLVSTDCLSEGVNLQEHFSAVIHYDLPWNPNRLEQREGRVDRYGQRAKVVKSYLMYGRNNPVDGAVLDVLIRKAVKIHETLGVTVPVPMESASVSEAVFQSLFDRSRQDQQLSLLDLLEDETTEIAKVHLDWDRAVDRDRISRTRFAQHAITPAEVQQELVEVEQALGSEADVERFVLSACDRLNYPLARKKEGWLLQQPPQFLQSVLGDHPRSVAFQFPAPVGAEYIGRNHPLVEGLAQHLLEQALSARPEAVAARCGLIVTRGVKKRTTLLLLRLRHLMESRKHAPLLAEECLLVGFRGSPTRPEWLPTEEARQLLQAEPSSDLPIAFKTAEMKLLLDRLDEMQDVLGAIAQERADVLTQAHKRVRTLTQEGALRIKPQLPMDILGVYVLHPGS